MKLDTDIDDRTLRVSSRQSEVKDMKEGDYLRQGIVLDDVTDDEDDVKKSGCLPHRPRSATFDSPSRQRHTSEPSHHKIAQKLLKIFKSHSAHESGRQSPTSRRQQPPRRRFMRVVKDENAPPPEVVGDNPNIICRYSQEYLTKHYAELERNRPSDSSSRPTLPYTTSGHTILKKSSTDPTSYRSATSTTTAAMKHTTFCDVVTVVDSEIGEVHEERLRQTADDDDEFDAAEQSPSETGFFLSPTDTEFPVDDVDGFGPDSCSVVEDELSELALSKDVSSAGLKSVFTPSALESDSPVQRGEEPRRKISDTIPATKHVKLVDLMAQFRDDGERS